MSKKYTDFPIRKEKPRASDQYGKCYIREANGGWNASIVGNPTDSECNVLSNCVGYASGRFSEIYCQITGKAGGHYKYFNGNPPSVPARVKQFYPWLKMDTKPWPGDLIAWQDHVAVCEQVISDNEILISDSAYNGAAFRTYKINNNNGRWGRSKFICFVHNGAVKEWEEPDPEVTDPVERNTAVDQVQATMDKYSNVRMEPVSGKVIGQLALGYYNILDTSKGGGYTWYKIAENNWVAGTIHITYLPAVKEEEKEDEEEIEPTPVEPKIEPEEEIDEETEDESEDPEVELEDEEDNAQSLIQTLIKLIVKFIELIKNLF